MVNLKKSIPETLASCKCLCCTDCGFYDENVSWENCVERNKLIRKQLNKMGKLT